MSWLMFATWVPALPGSTRFAPSRITAVEPLGCVPLAEKLPAGPLFVPVVWLLNPEPAPPLLLKVTPGIILISSAALRPVNVAESTSSLLSVALISAESTGISASAPEMTVTAVASVPIFKCMLGMVRLSPWLRRIPVSCHGAKLFALIDTVYVPGIKAVTEKKPELSALVSRISPVLSLLTMTWAPGMRASVWSAAIPLRVAVNCCALAMAIDKNMTGMSSHGIDRNHRDIVVFSDVFLLVLNIYQAS